MEMSVKALIAKFSGQSTMQIAEKGATEQYLATSKWRAQFSQTKDAWEKRCAPETTRSGNVRSLIRFWQARGL